jgi:hypothetical protein
MEEVTIIFAQFSVSNLSVVPGSVRWIKPEDGKKLTGDDKPVLVMENVSIKKLLETLEKTGYKVTDCYAQRRTSEKNMFYTAIRFTIEKGGNEDSNARKAFLKLSKENFWKAKCYQNEENVTLAFSGRIPLFDGNGNEIRVWDRDANKNKIGSEPKPIRPAGKLWIVDGCIELKEI